jgi:parallel beta-helix repeat protein
MRLCVFEKDGEMLKRTIILSILLAAVPCSATIITIEPDGSGDEATIQDAVDTAGTGDEIVLSIGTFTGDGNRDIDFGGKSITVRSTNPNDPNIVAVTIIDCQGTESEPHRGFSFISSEDANSILSGLTITNGYGPDEEIYFGPLYSYYSVGGAIYCYGSSPTITNCTITGNFADSRGGGMFNHEGSSPTVDSCTFSGNSAKYGGGISNRELDNGDWMSNQEYSSPTVTNCTFTGNSAYYGGGISTNYSGGMIDGDSGTVVINCKFIGNSADSRGGGIYYDYENGIITDCTFIDNFAPEGGGMYNRGDAMITDCTFTSNSANYGSGMYNVDDAMITDCTFTNNSADYGGGMYNNSSPIVDSCTFGGNSAENFGGGMCNGSDKPTITNCTFITNSAQSGGGMYNYKNSGPLIANCKFFANTADYGGGMTNLGRVYLASRPVLTSCIFSDNSASEEGGGVYNELDADMTAINCTFVGNSASHSGGIHNWASLTVTNSIFWGNSPEQVYAEEGSSLVITYCDVQGGYPDGTNIIDVDPLFVDIDGADNIFGTEDDNLRLQPGSLCIDVGDNNAVASAIEIDGNGRILDGDGNGTITVDLGAYEYQYYAYEGPVYVDQDATSGANNGLSWDNAFLTLQDALHAAAGNQNPVWVAEGTYLPMYDYGSAAGDRGKHFRMINGVAIYGGFDGTETNLSQRDVENNETILSGDLNGDDGPDFANNSDNCYHVFYHPQGANLDCTAVLDGFTITAGNANIGSYLDHTVYGGGMYNRFSSPTIANCKFTANMANSGGGMYNEDSNPTVTDCKFTANVTNYQGVGGGMCNDGGSPIITNCTFSKNMAAGGAGMGSTGSNPTVTNCIFTGNSGYYGAGGMYNVGSSPVVANCTFTGNTAGEVGGGMGNHYFSGPRVTNCTFSGNSAEEYGGGIYNYYYSSPTITNCTFNGNSAGQYGGGIRDVGGYLKVTNSVLWGNSASLGGNEIAVGGSIIDVDYCDVQGGQVGIYSDGSGILNWGAGNIDIDPQFVDANGLDNISGTEDDNLRLQPSSPCIDTGDPNFIANLNAMDLDGNQRIVNDIIDMGAYEVQLDDPIELLDILADDVIDLNLRRGIENSLLAKIDTAIAKLEDDNPKNDRAAVRSLRALINEVEAQSGKKINEEDAAELIEACQQIIEMLASG